MRELSIFLVGVLVAAFLLGLAVTPLLIRLAFSRQILDRPGNRKTHDKPVAYLGGLAVFSTLLIVIGFAFPLGLRDILESFSSQKIFIILASSFGVTLVGLWDDLFHIRPRSKFVGQLLFACLFAVFGFRFEVLQVPGFSPFPLFFMAVPVTVFWIISIVNALNLIDGVDGLAGSVTCGILGCTAVAGALMDNPGVILISLAGLGALLGFLRYNWTPAKIYLGDAGSNGLGMLVACLLISLGRTQPYVMLAGPRAPIASQPFPYQLFVLTLLAAYPAMEVLLSVTRRFLRGRPITRADKGHIHHRLTYYGWSNKWICVAAAGYTALAGSAALALLDHQYGKATWLLSTLALATGIALQFLGFMNFFRPKSIAKSRVNFQIAHHFITMQLLKLRLAHDWEEVMTLVNQTCNEFGVQGYRLIVRPGPNGKGRFHSSWERPLEEHQEYLNFLKTREKGNELTHFQDHATLPDIDAEAFWIFEPHSLEEELDVEYRVLVSEFITSVLRRIRDLKPSVIVVIPKDTPQGPHKKNVSSNLLRRRAARPKIR